ncbi:MAG: YqhA family protein, partial [Saprospiraceae bacterium]|nr:YqhA family protein [Saprospiraceae bacterium]
IFFIALFVSLSGFAFTILGAIEFVHAVSHIFNQGEEMFIQSTAIKLLQSVDMFLLSIVLYVFALGIVMLFHKNIGDELREVLPEWLQIRDFMQLKALLWEAILTTLVVSFLAYLVGIKLSGGAVTIEILVLPLSILIISTSLYLLKKRPKATKTTHPIFTRRIVAVSTFLSTFAD